MDRDRAAEADPEAAGHLLLEAEEGGDAGVEADPADRGEHRRRPAGEDLDRLAARPRDRQALLEERGALGAIEDRVIEIGHSDRSKTVIEPYWSDQWFVRMGDVPGGIVLGRGTSGEQTSAGLAQAAIDAVAGDWRSPSGRKLVFHPDGERYANTYLRWLEEKRDWCISRQLWWGHRIPIWQRAVDPAQLETVRGRLEALDARDDVCVRMLQTDGSVEVL
ncbi:MAG: class I tRNA ligase family protein, partial [Myxococcales bacterium]|nr:class I tRNA ligase family protein [Myxococcales bacterium]